MARSLGTSIKKVFKKKKVKEEAAAPESAPPDVKGSSQGDETDGGATTETLPSLFDKGPDKDAAEEEEDAEEPKVEEAQTSEKGEAYVDDNTAEPEPWCNACTIC